MFLEHFNDIFFKIWLYLTKRKRLNIFFISVKQKEELAITTVFVVDGKKILKMNKVFLKDAAQ